MGLSRHSNTWIAIRVTLWWHKPQMIWRGYNGSQMEYQQMPNGRLIVPFGSFQPHARPSRRPAGTRP